MKYQIFDMTWKSHNGKYYNIMPWDTNPFFNHLAKNYYFSSLKEARKFLLFNVKGKNYPTLNNIIYKIFSNV